MENFKYNIAVTTSVLELGTGFLYFACSKKTVPWMCQPPAAAVSVASVSGINWCKKIMLPIANQSLSTNQKSEREDLNCA